MRMAGLEPAPQKDQNLNLTRLPISPHALWCLCRKKQDSNLWCLVRTQLLSKQTPSATQPFFPDGQKVGLEPT